MSQQGIQAISSRARADKRYRQLLRRRPLKALEGYALTMVEHATLETLAANGWLLPGDEEPPEIQDGPKGCGCLATIVAALRRLFTDG